MRQTACYLHMLCLFAVPAFAATSLMDRIEQLEPIIGTFPPNIRHEDQRKAVEQTYLAIKSELDAGLKTKPADADFLFMRGYLQSMGQNFEHPGAWQAAVYDFKALLKLSPRHVPAALELGGLYLKSDSALALQAERLFRDAQCYYGSEALEPAQSGVFFALYNQGKYREALRHSDYLLQTWPQNPQYRDINKMTREVLANRAQRIDPEESVLDQPVMAGCNQ